MRLGSVRQIFHLNSTPKPDLHESYVKMVIICALNHDFSDHRFSINWHVTIYTKVIFLVGDTKRLRTHNFTSRTKRKRKSNVSKSKLNSKSSSVIFSTVSVSWQIVRRWFVFNRDEFIAKGDSAWRYYKGSSLVALAAATDWIRDTFLTKEPQEMRGQRSRDGGTVVRGRYFLYASVNEPKRCSDLYNDVRLIHNGARVQREDSLLYSQTCSDTCERHERRWVVMKLLDKNTPEWI